jgi:hypothetical protein
MSEKQGGKNNLSHSTILCNDENVQILLAVRNNTPLRFSDSGHSLCQELI